MSLKNCPLKDSLIGLANWIEHVGYPSQPCEQQLLGTITLRKQWKEIKLTHTYYEEKGQEENSMRTVQQGERQKVTWNLKHCIKVAP